MNQGYTKETFKLKLHKMVTYYKVAAIMEIIMGVGILALIAGAVALSVATAATFSGLAAGLGANLGAAAGLGALGSVGGTAGLGASLGEASNHTTAVAAAVVVVNGVFGFTFAVSWFVKIVMLILGAVTVSEIRNLAAANQKVLPFDPFVPGVVSFIVIIAVYFAWSRAHKLNLMADQLANDFQLSSQS